MTEQKQADLPRWRSHKVVSADKVIAFRNTGRGPHLSLECGGEIPVDNKFYSKLVEMSGSAGVIGGYYVRYEDGYESWSPAKAFEEGYTPVEDTVLHDWSVNDWWADDDGSDWDVDTGAPKLSYFANAVQVWALLQNKRVTVGMAADAFNVKPETIRTAVREHYWMMLVGPDDNPDQQTIDHEGE